jgi:hypothetical protein
MVTEGTRGKPAAAAAPGGSSRLVTTTSDSCSKEGTGGGGVRVVNASGLKDPRAGIHDGCVQAVECVQQHTMMAKLYTSDFRELSPGAA